MFSHIFFNCSLFCFDLKKKKKYDCHFLFFDFKSILFDWIIKEQNSLHIRRVLHSTQWQCRCLCRCPSENTQLSINRPEVRVVGLISLSWMSVLSNNSWVDQSEVFVHTERLESCVSCGVTHTERWRTHC